MLRDYVKSGDIIKVSWFGKSKEFLVISVSSKDVVNLVDASTSDSYELEVKYYSVKKGEIQIADSTLKNAEKNQLIINPKIEIINSSAK